MNKKQELKDEELDKTTGGMKIIILNEKIKEKMLEIIKNIKKKK